MNSVDLELRPLFPPGIAWRGVVPAVYHNRSVPIFGLQLVKIVGYIYFCGMSKNRGIFSNTIEFLVFDPELRFLFNECNSFCMADDTVDGLNVMIDIHAGYGGMPTPFDASFSVMNNLLSMLKFTYSSRFSMMSFAIC